MFKKPSGFFFIVCITCSLHSAAQYTMLDQVDNVYLDTLISLAKKNYPRVRYFQAKTNSSKQTLKAQKLSWFDPLTFAYQYLPNNTVSATQPVFLNGYQIGLFVNVGTIIQKPALIKKAKQDLLASTSDMEEYDKNLTAEVKRRYYDYLLQLNKIRVFGKNVMDADALLQNASIRYQKNEISFEEYSKTLVVFNGTLESKLEAESDLLIAKSSLEELVGVKLEEIKKDAGK